MNCLLSSDLYCWLAAVKYGEFLLSVQDPEDGSFAGEWGWSDQPGGQRLSALFCSAFAHFCPRSRLPLLSFVGIVSALSRSDSLISWFLCWCLLHVRSSLPACTLTSALICWAQALQCLGTSQMSPTTRSHSCCRYTTRRTMHGGRSHSFPTVLA